MQKWPMHIKTNTESSELFNVELFAHVPFFMVLNPPILIFLCKIVYRKHMCFLLLAWELRKLLPKDILKEIKHGFLEFEPFSCFSKRYFQYKILLLTYLFLMW